MGAVSSASGFRHQPASSTKPQIEIYRATDFSFGSRSFYQNSNSYHPFQNMSTDSPGRCEAELSKAACELAFASWEPLLQIRDRYKENHAKLRESRAALRNKLTELLETEQMINDLILQFCIYNYKDDSDPAWIELEKSLRARQAREDRKVELEDWLLLEPHDEDCSSAENEKLEDIIEAMEKLMGFEMEHKRILEELHALDDSCAVVLEMYFKTRQRLRGNLGIPSWQELQLLNLGQSILALFGLEESTLRSDLENEHCTDANSRRNAASKTCRHGRGQRKNRQYWNWRRDKSDLDFLERDLLISAKNGSLTIPAIARMEMSSEIPFTISAKYINQQGKGPDIDTNLTDDERRNIIGDPTQVLGIIRRLPFRVRGTSRTFFQDFIVTSALDGVVDILIGWKFMWDEFKLLFEDVRDKVTGWFKGAASDFSNKISTLASDLRTRAADFLSSSWWSHPPEPPYSLVDMCSPESRYAHTGDAGC